MTLSQWFKQRNNFHRRTFHAMQLLSVAQLDVNLNAFEIAPLVWECLDCYVKSECLDKHGRCSACHSQSVSLVPDMRGKERENREYVNYDIVNTITKFRAFFTTVGRSSQLC